MSVQLKKIEIKDLAELKRVGTANDSSTTDPLYYYKLQKTIGFVTAVGSAVTSATTVTVWYYRVPLSDGTEDTSNTVSPIIDRRWDDALCYGACFQLTGEPRWLALFESELTRMRSLQNAQVDRTYQIATNRDYD